MRVLLWILAVPLGLIVVAMILVPLLVDEDTLVRVASEQLENRSGIELSVEGDASLSLFPTLGLSMSEVRAVLPDEGGTLEAQSLATGVALLPLLGGSVEIESLRLEGVTITTVATDEAAARTAAMDTSQLSNAELDAYYAARREMRERSAAEAAANSLGVAVALEVGELMLRDIRAVTVDRAGAVISEVLLEELVASDLNIDGRVIPLTARVVVPATGNGPPVEILLDAGVAPDLDENLLRIDHVRLRISGATAAPLELSASGAVALTTQVADLDVELGSDGLEGGGNIRYAAYESPQIDATLQLSQLNPALLVLAGPEAAAASDTSESGGSALPLHALRMVDSRARLTVERVILEGHELTDVNAVLRAVDGVVTLEPVTARVHGGEIDFTVNFNGRYNTATLATQGGVTGLDVGRAVAALEAGVGARGQADLTWNLEGRGATADELNGSLSGPVQFLTEDITIEGIAMEQMVCRGVALVNQETLTAEFPADTRFTDLSADIQLGDGVARLDPLTAELRAVTMTGTGSLALSSGELRASLRAQLAAGLADLDPACRINERYADLRWPVECKGNLDGDPADWCSLNTGEIVRDLAEGELKRKAEEEAGKLFKKLFDR